MTFAANDGMVWHYRDEIEIRKYHYRLFSVTDVSILDYSIKT
jgi:hypothetical protein